MVSHSHWCIFLNKSLNQKAILYRQMQCFSPLKVAPVVPYKEWEFISNEAIQPKHQSKLISKSQNTRMNLFKRPSQYLKCFVCLCLCLQPFSIFLQSCVAQGFIKSGMCLQYLRPIYSSCLASTSTGITCCFQGMLIRWQICLNYLPSKPFRHHVIEIV